MSTTLDTHTRIDEHDPTPPESDAAVAALGDIAVQSPILLVSDELAFGGLAFEDGAPVDPGTLGWGRNDVDRVFTPFVSGYFHHTDAAGVRAGIQVKTWDSFGALLSSHIHRVPVVEEDGHQVSDAQFLLSSFSSPHIHRINVSIVNDVSDPLDEDQGPVWRWITGQNHYLYDKGDPVRTFRLLASDFDFGASSFADGEPTGNGLLVWNEGTSTVRPQVGGTLHAENAISTEVALRLRGLDVFGNRVGVKRSDSLRSTTNDHTSMDINVELPADPSIFRVRAELVLEDGGRWLPIRGRTFQR